MPYWITQHFNSTPLVDGISGANTKQCFYFVNLQDLTNHAVFSCHMLQGLASQGKHYRWAFFSPCRDGLEQVARLVDDGKASVSLPACSTLSSLSLSLSPLSLSLCLCSSLSFFLFHIFPSDLFSGYKLANRKSSEFRRSCT